MLAPASTAIAQSREVLIGTFGQHAPGDDRAAGVTNERHRDVRERGDVAARMLADALEAIDRGDIMVGRNRLERLAASYPDTLAATTARHELKTLYRSGEAVRHGEAAAGAAAPGQAEPRVIETQIGAPESPRPTAPEGPAAAAAGGDRQIRVERRNEALRTQQLALDFQTSTGDRVFFANTSADLGARARGVLSSQARWLAARKDIAVTIEAHADDSGAPELNLQLARARGQAVRDRLVEEGVDAERIKVIAFGRDQPVANCPAPACSAQNRRVVTRIGDATSDYARGESTRNHGQPAFANGNASGQR